MENDKKNSRGASAFSPLRLQLFRALWIASIASNIGTWIQEVGAGWLMTSLTTSPTLVGFLETSMTLPMFLLSLPAGALADIVDRRRILITTQSWMVLVSAVMAFMAFSGIMTPWILLGLTFLLSIGAAVNGPAWQAIIPELVPRAELPTAIALGSVGFNVARAIGPALGGLIIAASGPWAAFTLNAISFLGVIVVLYQWRRERRVSVLPAERILSGIRAGVRYARHAPMLQTVLIRTAVFIVFGSAMWATLPYIARHEMGLTAVGFGMLMGAFGVGAVSGAAVMTKLRGRVSVEAMVNGSTLTFAGLLLALALTRVFALVMGAMFVGGVAWMILMSSMNTAAQIASPSWVRARAMAIYILVFMGGLAAGSALWGVIATHGGTPVALSSAAVGLFFGMIVARKHVLITDHSVDHTPSMHWPEPILAIEPDPNQGPVLVTVEYRIKLEDGHRFLEALSAVSKARRRDGAMQWGVFQDVADPNRYVEHYIVESWAEHMRQHERVTQADRVLEERVHAFHLGNERPAIAHFIYADRTRINGYAAGNK